MGKIEVRLVQTQAGSWVARSSDKDVSGSQAPTKDELRKRIEAWAKRKGLTVDFK